MILHQVEIFKDGEWVKPEDWEVQDVTSGEWSISEFEYPPHAQQVVECFHQFGIPARIRKVVE